MFYHLESILSLSQQFKGKSVQLEYETCQARFQKLVCFSFLLDSQFWVPTQSLLTHTGLSAISPLLSPKEHIPSISLTFPGS